MELFLIEQNGKFTATRFAKTVANHIGVNRKTIAENLKNGIYLHSKSKTIIRKIQTI